MERVGSLLRVGDHTGEEVRGVVVLAQLYPLGVHQDQADLLGRSPHQHRGEQRVDARRLAGPGGSGDQHVRKLGEPEHAWRSRHVHADADEHRVVVCLRLVRCQDVADGDEVALAVRHLDTDRRLPRDGCEDPHVGRRERIGDVVAEVRDLVDLHARGQLDLVARHGRPGHDPNQAGVHAVLLECVFERLARLRETAPIVSLRPAQLENVQWRQLVSLCGGRGSLLGRCRWRFEQRGIIHGRLDLHLRRDVRLDGNGGLGLPDVHDDLGLAWRIDDRLGTHGGEARPAGAHRRNEAANDVSERGTGHEQRPNADDRDEEDECAPESDQSLQWICDDGSDRPSTVFDGGPAGEWRVPGHQVEQRDRADEEHHEAGDGPSVIVLVDHSDHRKPGRCECERHGEGTESEHVLGHGRRRRPDGPGQVEEREEYEDAGDDEDHAPHVGTVVAEVVADSPRDSP